MRYDVADFTKVIDIVYIIILHAVEKNFCNLPSSFNTTMNEADQSSNCPKLVFPRCRAAVTSPLSLYWTECFIIVGDYTLTTGKAVGWHTAARQCFDPAFTQGTL